VIIILCTVVGFAQTPGDTWYRWFGHDFAFCFVTDDGCLPNLAWAELARAMDFRFTIAINIRHTHNGWFDVLTLEDLETLAADGFEIAQHGYSHGHEGLSEACPMPPRGSLMGYFMCAGEEQAEVLEALHAEIERDSLAVIDGLSAADVRTLTYPRHLHGKALIDSLIAEGYVAARTGGKYSYAEYSYRDFDRVARNGWDEGISLFRLPTTASDRSLFGDHGADPPRHFSYAEFVAATQAHIDYHKLHGGVFVLTTHHLGDDDDSYGDINYGSGGVSVQDLAWIVDLVRMNNGIVLTFDEAVTYFRSRSAMTELDGDFVWAPIGTDVEELPLLTVSGLSIHPNPFNPRTIVEATLARAGRASLGIYDSRGNLVKMLMQGHLEAGIHSWPWLGRDEEGRSLGAGVYIAHLRCGSERATRRLLLLK